ncbi:MAG: SCO family protein [Chitinophagales bacterium]
MRKKKYFVFAGILIIIVVLPLISYLLVKKGYDLRVNATYSQRFDSAGTTQLPDYSFLSHRGDTISSTNMQGKVLVIELVSKNCADDSLKLRHPLFELQEDYKNKTRRLRILSVITDSVFNTAELQAYASRFAARDEWHVLGGAISTLNPVLRFYENYLQEKNIGNANLLCPENVLLIDKEGIVRGAYNIYSPQEFSDLYNDVLYLIDK